MAFGKQRIKACVFTSGGMDVMLGVVSDMLVKRNRSTKDSLLQRPKAINVK